MKKITDIKAVTLDEVMKHLKNGWELYGYPMVPAGNAPYPHYQCMVKYADEEIVGKIVEFIEIEAHVNEVVGGRHTELTSKAKKHIEAGYQPYGFINRTRTNQHGDCFTYDYLAMVKYE